MIKRSLNISIVFILLILASGCSTVKAPPGEIGEATAWSSLFSGPAREGSTPDALAPPFEKIWSAKIRPFESFKTYPREQLSVPVIAENSIYVGSTNNRVYAFDIESGKKLWQYDAGSPVESTPTVGSDLVCFGSSMGYLHCLKKKTGELLWSFRTGSEVISSPLITKNSVYFYSSADRLFALDIKSGKEIWSYRRSTYEMVSPRSRTSPALTADGEFILQLFSDGTLVSVNAFTGKILWEVKTFKPHISSPAFRSTPAISGDTVFVPGKNFKVQARLIENGRLLKTYDSLKARDFLLAGKRGLVLASENEVALQSEKSGQLIWKKRPMEGKGIISEIALAGETLLVLINSEKKRFNLDFLTSRQGHIIAMSLTDGHVMWSEEFSTTLTGGVSSYGGRFTLLTDNGYLEVWGP
ncbi:MAG: PQQ-binding-like beta-propeller repeat protein [Thermodesulfobacteriota bacterium]